MCVSNRDVSGSRRELKTQNRSFSLVLAPSNATSRRIHQFLLEDLKFATNTHKLDIRLANRQALVDSLSNPSATKDRHTVLVTTPRSIQHIVGKDSISSLNNTDLVIASDLHNMTPDYEYTLSCLVSAVPSSPRVIGYTAPLLDARSLAVWLQVDPVHTYSFQPLARPNPVITSFTSFNLPSSPGLLKAMVKPAYEAMRSNLGSTICFVPHRSQCYTTLADFLTTSATDMNKLVEMDEELLAQYALRISDPKIAEGIQHGFAMFNESMSPADQVIVRHLFNTHAVRALIASRDSCHSLDMTASLVIVMSTQYATYDRQTDERRIVDYAMDDLLQMQAIPAEHYEKNQTENGSGQCMIFTQPDKASLISKFINEGLPLESSLLGSEILFHAILSRISSQIINDKQKCLDAICTTFLAERVQENPFYYGRKPAAPRNGKAESKNERLSSLVDDILEEMRVQLLIRFENEESTSMKITPFGKAVSQNRIPQKEVDQLFDVKESAALKMLQNNENVQKITDSVKEVELKAFLNRLPKSLQRKIRSEGVKAPKPSGQAGNDKDLRAETETGRNLSKKGNPALESSETAIDIGKALLLTFLSKKLPPAGCKLEIAQARLAMVVMDQLVSSSTTRRN